MDGRVYESTEFCRSKIISHESKDLPFAKLQAGKSFFIPSDVGLLTEGSIRSLVSAASTRLGRIFKCVKHKKEGFYEITEVTNVELVTFQIVESSPEAKAFYDDKFEGRRKFPFLELPDGMSFIVPISSTNENSLRVQCSVQSKKLDKKFICVKHEQYGMFEVYNKPKEPLKFYEPSAQALEK